MGKLRHLLLAGGVAGVTLAGVAGVPAATNLTPGTDLLIASRII
jgi:hypothetical protein